MLAPREVQPELARVPRCAAAGQADLLEHDVGLDLDAGPGLGEPGQLDRDRDVLAVDR